MKFIICGDLVPTESNYNLFENSKTDELIGKGIKNIFLEADYRIFNLECPLYDESTPIPKTGPNLMAPASTIHGIKALNPSLIGLANNHILDHDKEGLFSTMKVLQDNKINFIGAGKDLEEAAKTYTYKSYGKKVGVYACAENEFSIASEDKPGANPFDPLESFDHVSKLKQNSDYVIVLYHGGKEHYRYPSPNLQKICHKFAEKGADLIICQHSHCISCIEEYKGSKILYGQGNFLFDRSESEFWQTSLLVSVELNDTMNVDYIPICKNGNGVRLANEKEKEEILSEFCKRSRQILDKGFIEKNYLEFAEEILDRYLYAYLNADYPFEEFQESKLSNRYYLGLLNRTRCEAHNEVITTAIKHRLERRFKNEY